MKNKGIEMINESCFFCGSSKGTIVIDRKLPDHSKRLEELKEDMDGKVANMIPCSQCKKFMGMGVILIAIDSEKSDEGWQKEDIPNPYRTGPLFVITDDATRELVNDDSLLAFALQYRWMFIEHEAAEHVGLFEYLDDEENDDE